MKLAVLVTYVLLAQAMQDPLGPILKPVLKPTLDETARRQARAARYTDADFPMKPETFARFRDDVSTTLAHALGLEDWVVRAPRDGASPIADLFVDRTLATIERHGIQMEVHTIEIRGTGLRVPLVVCLPEGNARRPGIVVLSGHSKHGLRDLVLDLESYQRGLAVRLAQAGFVAAAVEKIDTGYLARSFGDGSDEERLAATLLGLGSTIRAEQLRAALAATEILALHPRVDRSQLGSAGVSLGGWLALQTALLDDRIGAVADFGRKTLGSLGEEGKATIDPCLVLPGLLTLGERNLFALAYAPRALLAGHGRKDADSMRQGPAHFESLLRAQYEALGRKSRFEYLVHDGGDTMPERAVVDYFRRTLGPR
jgi:dienelactone hydrolase